jgi:hypothetical protein
VHSANEQGEEHQKDTEVWFHDDHVPQGVTNGHIAIIGHHCEDSFLHQQKSKQGRPGQGIL